MPGPQKVTDSGGLSLSNAHISRPPEHRFGETVLLYLFLALLAGRFTLSRISEDAPVSSDAFDLRILFAGGAILLVLAWLAGVKAFLPPRIPLVGAVPFLLWCSWLALSAEWAPAGARTNEVLTDLLFLALLVILSWLVMSHLPSNSMNRVWTWLVATGAIYFILALLSGPDGQGRFAAPGGGPNTFVRIMVIAAIAALYLISVEKRTWPLYLVPVFAVGAALSGSRGGLLSAAIVFVFFAVPLTRRLGRAKSVALLIVGLVGAIASTFWRDGYLVDFVQRRFIQQTFREGYSSGRDEISDQAWDMFTTSPVLGVGLDGYYPLQVGVDVVYQHPHNLVLSSLAEAGVVGGILLGVALIRLIARSVSTSMTPTTTFALACGLYFFGTSLFSGDYYDSRFTWFFLGFSAISALRNRAEQSRITLHHPGETSPRAAADAGL